MMRGQWAIVFATILILPACVFQPNKQVQRKSSRHLQGAGSIFASVSEETIRQEVRACHASEPQDQSLTRMQSHQLSKKRTLERAAERQAQLVDVPVPLNVKPLPDFFAQDSVASHETFALGYTAELSMNEVVKFYQQEMERHGWRVMASGAAGKETLHYFVKPDRFCSVSIRPQLGKSKRKKEVVEIVIFTGRVSNRL